jgi:hypothetical protein
VVSLLCTVSVAGVATGTLCETRDSLTPFLIFASKQVGDNTRRKGRHMNNSMMSYGLASTRISHRHTIALCLASLTDSIYYYVSNTTACSETIMALYYRTFPPPCSWQQPKRVFDFSMSMHHIILHALHVFFYTATPLSIISTKSACCW